MSETPRETLAPNGRTLRTFHLDGLLISEVEFTIEDLGNPVVVGYMVGLDDGQMGLDTTPEKAVAAYRNRYPDSSPPPAPSPATMPARQQEQDLDKTENGQLKSSSARAAPVCECGHPANEHGATGLCLVGFNAAIHRYTNGSWGRRACQCNDYRPARPRAAIPPVRDKQ